MTAIAGPGHHVRVIVCGNADRGDDGVGPAALRLLQAARPRGVSEELDVRQTTELRVEDLVDLPSESACLIVDAVAGVDPGRVVRLPLNELGDRSAFTPRSSHQLPIHLVVGLAAVLREQPVAGTFLGLGGLAFGYGTPLSPVASVALPDFAVAIERELDDLVRTAPRSAPPAAQEGAA